jgi:hypothetical protein
VAHTYSPSYSGGRRIAVRSQPGQQFDRPYLEKPFTKTELVEWVKVKALSLSPSTAKTAPRQKKQKTN